MAAASGAFGSKCGYNQSAGGYYLIVSTIAPANLLSVSTAASGSGGATVPAVLATYSGWAADGQFSTLLTAGNVLKDMGKTVVTAGRTYRKFQATANVNLSTNGVTGTAATALNTGYLTGYLEVPQGGAPATTTNLIARMY